MKLNNTNIQQPNGIGFVGALTIAFIVLKLTGHIDWSWVWITSPIWILWSFIFVIIVVIGIPVLLLLRRR